MADSTVRVVARIIARGDRISELKALLQSIILPTRAEKGCIQYDLLQNQADPTDFTFVEIWASHADLDAHLASEHIQAALLKLEGLVEVMPDIRRYQIVE